MKYLVAYIAVGSFWAAWMLHLYDPETSGTGYATWISGLFGVAICMLSWPLWLGICVVAGIKAVRGDRLHQ